MARPSNGDSNYSDNDLDDLDCNVLAELEQNAVEFTQKAATHVSAPTSSDYGDEFDDDDLDDAVLIDEARSAPAVVPLSRNAPASAYQREQFRQQRYGDVQTSQVASRSGNDIERPLQWQDQAPQELDDPVVARLGSLKCADQVEILQQRVAELTNERNFLKQEINAKSGEISIVRSKSEKQTKETERELSAIKKLHADQLAKKQQEIEAVRIAEKNAKTDLDFTKQDLAEEVERTRRLSKDKVPDRKDGANITPKKKKILPHRDGFDDVEVEMLSPSKVGSPSKFQKRQTGSPSKAGAKRKRKAHESPATGALDIVQAHEALIKVPEPEHIDPMLNETVLEKMWRQDDRVDFLGNMLDHRPRQGHPRTIEELGKHALPSSPSPKEAFQSTILGAIPFLGRKKPVTSLAIEFCELLIGLWSQCVNEKYLKPVYLFIDMLAHALETNPLSIAPHIIESLIPLALRTADLVAIPRFNRKSADPCDQDIDVSACLSIIHLAALGCISEPEPITKFWKLMRWDFVLMMLSHNHPIGHYEMMLEILSTSIARNSFGTIQEDLDSESTNAQTVGYIIERLTWPLFEIPYLPMSHDKVPNSALSSLRLKIIELLIRMTQSPYAGRALATHPKAIGRLISFMSDELDTLYDYNSRHDESAHLVTLSMRLLYHLITRYEEIVDMPTKLIPIRGSTQKYLLVLARLNFSDDDLVLGKGIANDVQGYALELLDSAVTPEEAEAVESAFGSM